jgi:hypothetical protein
MTSIGYNRKTILDVNDKMSCKDFMDVMSVLIARTPPHQGMLLSRNVCEPTSSPKADFSLYRKQSHTAGRDSDEFDLDRWGSGAEFAHLFRFTKADLDRVFRVASEGLALHKITKVRALHAHRRSIAHHTTYVLNCEASTY